MSLSLKDIYYCNLISWCFCASMLSNKSLFIMCDDPEAIGDGLRGPLPVPGKRFVEKVHDRLNELPEIRTAPVVRHMTVHDAQQLPGGVEMGAWGGRMCGRMRQSGRAGKGSAISCGDGGHCPGTHGSPGGVSGSAPAFREAEGLCRRWLSRPGHRDLHFPGSNTASRVEHRMEFQVRAARRGPDGRSLRADDPAVGRPTLALRMDRVNKDNGPGGQQPVHHAPVIPYGFLSRLPVGPAAAILASHRRSRGGASTSRRPCGSIRRRTAQESCSGPRSCRAAPASGGRFPVSGRACPRASDTPRGPPRRGASRGTPEARHGPYRDQGGKPSGSPRCCRRRRVKKGVRPCACASYSETRPCSSAVRKPPCSACMPCPTRSIFLFVWKIGRHASHGRKNR